MRLSVTLDSHLVDEAMRISGATSKRAAIEAALREFVRRRRLEEMIARAGKVPLTYSVEDLRKERAEE